MSSPGPAPSGARVVVGCAVVMIVAHLGFLAWALSPSWFYLDDFFLIGDAPSGLSLSYLLEPHDSQLMSFGRAVAWFVATAGGGHWSVAAALTLALQAAASAACAWALVTLFGVRGWVLALLGVYLSSAMTMSATMWWAASLNALPLQIAVFCSVGCWFRYQRTRRVRWLLLTLLAIAFGLSAYVKALFLIPLLGGMTLAYFADGGLGQRVATVVRRDRVAVGAAVAGGGAYLAYYLVNTPRLASDVPADVVGPLAERMLGEALSVGLLGGPWRWNGENPPVGLADAPDAVVSLAWVVLIALAVFFALRRERTGRAWALLIGYALASFLMVLVTRAPIVGSIAGLEYRYLSDVACVWPIVLGLVALPLDANPRGSSPRPDPLLRVAPTPLVAGVALTALLVSGVVSSSLYVGPWHDDNDADQYFHAATSTLRDTGPIDLADQVVPDRVIPGYQFPRNRLAELLPLFVDEARFPDMSGDLAVIDDSGTPRRATIDVAVKTPPGPDGDCGNRVDATGGIIRLDAPTIDYPWWVRVGYLSFAEDVIAIDMAGQSFTVPVRRGLHSTFLRVDGIISTIRVTGVAPDNAVCVDVVEIGEPEPGGPL
ncbi:hypothetical protein KUV85_03670 [Nocardioides panacisoli]|uniref:hypothetical protein n=1 Tax=Nocardioides panacisoli TaxID=627624 RepID=UPI001C6301F3|nr:hypothetical protein [Nocardioides panacisoli]QYJ04792.1 hypothetical protein KUV85_03670 [Nocardioides panacisoli]